MNFQVFDWTRVFFVQFLLASFWHQICKRWWQTIPAGYSQTCPCNHLTNLKQPPEDCGHAISVPSNREFKCTQCVLEHVTTWELQIADTRGLPKASIQPEKGNPKVKLSQSHFLIVQLFCAQMCPNTQYEWGKGKVGFIELGATFITDYRKTHLWVRALVNLNG